RRAWKHCPMFRLGDFVPGYEASSWLGFGAPKNMPAAVVDRLNKEINFSLSDSAIKARLVDLGGLVLPPSKLGIGKLERRHRGALLANRRARQYARTRNPSETSPRLRPRGFLCGQPLALLWQIYSGRWSLQIHFRQCGHRCGGSRAKSSRMAWRTAGKVG